MEMSDHQLNFPDDPSRRLNIMAAAAVEHMSSALAASGAGAAIPPPRPPSPASSPPRRSKLVLPTLTPAMQQDLALSKGATGKGSRPLSITARPEFADYPLKGIMSPHPHDVLCGRGGGSNNHPGNESFRELVNEVKFPYVNCPKREKPLIARRIVEAVRGQTPPGRFLSKDAKTGLWNDIGDGKAREKTSQALREGAPIIRDMIGKPTSPTNVAAVLKEAKKAERAEKEYGVRLPRRARDKCGNASPVAADDPRGANADSDVPSSPLLASGEPVLKRIKKERYEGPNPPEVLSSCITSPVVHHGLPYDRFRSFGERDDPNMGGGGAPPAWHVPQQSRGFGMVPYAPPSAHHAGPLMGGFASHPRPPPDYAAGTGMPARYPPLDSVSVETVRRLLLGQLDPVQLALQVLSPEEAAVVARRHAAAGLHHAMGSGHHHSATGTYHGGGAHIAGPAASHPLQLAPVVSDGSSSSSSSAAGGDTRRLKVDGAEAATQGSASGSGDEASSVDSSSKQSSNGGGERRALPKKKRKYIEEGV